jgi:hypothetical protein
LQPLPLPEGFGDIRSQIHHPIHLPFTVGPCLGQSRARTRPGCSLRSRTGRTGASIKTSCDPARHR